MEGKAKLGADVVINDLFSHLSVDIGFDRFIAESAENFD